MPSLFCCMKIIHM